MRKRLAENIDDLIKDEVMSLSMTTGLGSVSTKQIAKNLGISEPVIFSHFLTKKKLIQSTFVTAWERFSDSQKKPFLASAFNSEEISFESLKKGISETLKYKKELCFLKQYFSLPAYYDPVLAHQVEQPYLTSLSLLFTKSIPQKERNFNEMMSLFVEIIISNYYDLAYYPTLDNDRTRRFLTNMSIFGMINAIHMDDKNEATAHG